MKILIDGENLRHQIAHVLHTNQKISDWNDYFKFDLPGFLTEALRADTVDVTYYTTRIKQPEQKIPQQLQDKITDITTANRRWVADLTNQGVTVVKAGYLRVRESSACVHCGKRTLHLQEKGVDVRVATDLLTLGLAGDDQSLVIASSDSDLLPAITAVRATGTDVTYICYAGWVNRSVSSQASKTITFDDELVLKYFKGSK